MAILFADALCFAEAIWAKWKLKIHFVENVPDPI